MKRRNQKIKRHKKHLRIELHPVVRLFYNPKVRRYFKKEKKRYLEFGDIQYILCKKKPRKESWMDRWQEYFPLSSGKTGLEVYNSKEYLFQKLKKLRLSFPKILIHSKSKGYRLSVNTVKNVTREYMLSKLAEYPVVTDLYDTAYFGIDLDLLKNEQIKNFEMKVHSKLIKLSDVKKIIRDLWVHQCLNEFINRVEIVWNGIKEEDKGHFLGYLSEHVKWFIKVCGQEEFSFKDYISRIQPVGEQSMIKYKNDAKTYQQNIDRIMDAHGNDIKTYVRNQRLKSTEHESHFNIVKKAVSSMVRDDVVSKDDARWLRIQQDMSELYARKLGKYLSFRVAERAPIVVIDTGLV